MLFSLKYGTEPAGVQREVWFALGVMAQIHRQMFGTPLVITSLKDSDHMENSKHALGEAADARARELSIDQRIQFHDACEAALNEHGFDLVIEGPPFNNRLPHEHCEFDPKSGESFLKFTE